MDGDIGWTVIESPVGPLTLSGGRAGLREVAFDGQASPRAPRRPMPEVTAQLEAYFAGELREFDLDLDLRGSPLQIQVWGRLREIPYGSTVTYGELAEQIDAAAFTAGTEPWERARAVGAEVGRTPTPIVVPCHRVIGADGSLTGYGGGLWRKRTLLDLEMPQQALL